MTFLAVEEVQAIAGFLDRNRVLLGVVFEDQLFEIEESTLVRNFLSNLDDSFPCIFGGEFGAIGALSVLDKIFDLEGLL